MGAGRITPEITEVIAKGVPDSEMVIFEDSSHMSFMEEPDRFVEVADAFLTKVEASG